MSDSVKRKKNPRIVTKNVDGNENGYLIPIININEGFVASDQWPQQVYCTVANPGEIKGPHLHKKRCGLFTCIKGNIKIVVKQDSKYEELYSGEDYDYHTVYVPAGVPSALVNLGDVEAFILNMPSPSWSPEEPDDWPVSFDDYDFGNR